MGNRAATLMLLTCFSSACGIPEERFIPEFERALCEYTVDCIQSYPSVDACFAERGTDYREEVCDGYDPSAAADCIAAFEEPLDRCEMETLDELPDACDSVCEVAQ